MILHGRVYEKTVHGEINKCNYIGPEENTIHSSMNISKYIYVCS